MANKKATLKDLIPDPNNANKHSEYGTGLLQNSTRELGFGRSILISSDNVIIAGNGVAEAGGSIGMEDVEIVDTDGKKIIAVRRTDIKSGTDVFHQMALADNIVAMKNIVMDAEVVEAIVEEYPTTKFWAGVIQKEDKERVIDKDAANSTETKFQLNGQQSAKLKQALKLAKQIKKPPKNVNGNSHALMTIVAEFLKANAAAKK